MTLNFRFSVAIHSPCPFQHRSVLEILVANAIEVQALKSLNQGDASEWEQEKEGGLDFEIDERTDE